MSDFEQIDLGARTPWDAVIVTVRCALGRTVADVAAVEYIADFPMPVPKALAAAAVLRDNMGLKRIAVCLEDENLWRPEWGSLIANTEAAE
jgi:hypothetical protein